MILAQFLIHLIHTGLCKNPGHELFMLGPLSQLQQRYLSKNNQNLCSEQARKKISLFSCTVHAHFTSEIVATCVCQKEDILRKIAVRYLFTAIADFLLHVKYMQTTVSMRVCTVRNVHMKGRMDVYTIHTCKYIRIMVQCNHTNSMYYVQIYVHMHSSIVFTCTMRCACFVNIQD